MSKEKKGKETENQIEEKRSQIKISVRNLVEFIFREGDIDELIMNLRKAIGW